MADGIANNLETVRRRLMAAHGRSAASRLHPPRLIAVSKTFPAEDVRAAARADQRDFGENRVQEGLDKIEACRDLNLTWHLIGHLQTNKARKAAAAFDWIHSIDRIELLRKVDEAAADAGRRPSVLIQVDLAGETTKFGAPARTVRDIARAALECRAARLRGLMVIPPAVDDPEEARQWFRALRDLRDALLADGVDVAALSELSMGMSHDFEVAVEEGATMVRVGSALFGQRT